MSCEKGQQMSDLGPIIHQWLAKDDAYLIEQIDERGGWPVKAKSLVMRHGDKRDCYFSERESVHDGWNTSVFTADDYYWEKLSDKRKEEFAKERIRNALFRAMP